MNPIDLLFEKKLLTRLQELREQKFDTMLTRQSHEDYLYTVGYIRALQEMEIITQEVHREIVTPEKS